MRFLLLNQFYLPDMAPTGAYLHDLARSLVQRGHSVTVLCSRRSYDGAARYPAREVMDGVEVVRLPATAFGRRGFVGKLSDYASFYGAMLFALFAGRHRPDLILSLTTPPYLGLLGKLAANRHHCRHAHWIMDLYPDVMFAHGMIQQNGVLARLLRALTRFQLKGAERVLSLGQFMTARLCAYTGPSTVETSTDSIPLWCDRELKPWPADEPNPLRTQRGWTEGETVFLYSGNMGLGHRFGEFLEAAKQMGTSGPRWIFSGGGKRRPELMAAAGALSDSRIEFLDYVPAALLRAHLCSADVHLASLDSSWRGSIVPSKLQASFAVGRPVLFVGSRDSETASWILQSGGGWVVAENDVPGLLHAVRQALDPAERARRGEAALAFASRNFQMTENCARLARLLEQSPARQDFPLRTSDSVPVANGVAPMGQSSPVAPASDHLN